jgi:hypothetical protein
MVSPQFSDVVDEPDHVGRERPARAGVGTRETPRPLLGLAKVLVF